MNLNNIKSNHLVLSVFFLFFLFQFCVVASGQTWANNDIGMTQNVPSPWTNLKIINRNGEITIDCWNRQFEFNSLGALNQIYIGGVPLLKNTLQLVFDNNSNYWKSTKIDITKRTSAEINLEFVSNSLIDPTIIKTTKVRIFFDGLIYYTVNLVSSKKMDFDIKLNIPLDGNQIKYINRPMSAEANSNNVSNAGLLGSGMGIVDKTSYVPYIWLGNSDKGLFTFVEFPDTWFNYKAKDAILVSRVGGLVNLVLNITQSKQNIGNAWSFSFGIQATPVKPMNPRWRTWQLGPLATSNINMIWPQVMDKRSLRYYGYPEATNPKAFKDYVRDLSKGNKKVLVYNCLTFTSSQSPEWKTFGNQWGIGRGDNYSSDVKSYGGSFVRTDPNNRLFSDFVVSKSKDLLTTAGFNGYYLDNTLIDDLNSVKVIKKSKYSTTKFPYYPIMAYRNLYERFYKMVKGVNPNNLIFVHSSARIVPPILSFADAYVDGEQFKNYKMRVKDDYLKLTSLASFQSEFAGKPYGLPAIFIPEFTSQFSQSVEPTRKLAAILLLHDILVWPVWSNTNIWVERNRILNLFPELASAKFISYYDKNRLFFSDKVNVYVSAYKNRNDEYLMIIANLSNSIQKVNIGVTNNSISFKSYDIVNESSLTKFHSTNDNLLPVSLDKGSYLAIYLKK